MAAAGLGLIVLGFVMREADVLRHNSLQFALTVVGIVLLVAAAIQRLDR